MFDMIRFIQDYNLKIKSFNILDAKFDSFGAYNAMQGPGKMQQDMTCKKLFPMMKFDDGKPQCYSGGFECLCLLLELM